MAATSSLAPTPCSFSTTAPRRKMSRAARGQLVNLGFSARHDGISVWVLTQQITSISKPTGTILPRSCYSTRPVARLQKLSLKTTPASSPTRSTRSLSPNLRSTSSPTWFSLFDIRTGLNTNAEIYIGNGHAHPSAQAHCSSQLLDRLRTHTLDAQNAVIKAAGKEDLRLMLLNRYPLRLNSMPDTMVGVIREMEALLPDVKRIIEI